jgi:hypothetical protein
VAPPVPLTPAEIRKYAPVEHKVYEGTPFGVNFLVEQRAGNGLSSIKLSPTTVKVIDTAFSRAAAPVIVNLEEGFDLNKVLSDIGSEATRQHPDITITSPPGFMLNPANVNQFADRLVPLAHTLHLIEQEERYKRAKERKSLAEREGELAGLFGGKKRRKTHRRSKKTGKKHVVRRRRVTRKH